MELQRKIRALASNMSPSPGKAPPPSSTHNQGLATLIVMIVVLTIIILFCCFAAPGIRDLCKKYVFRSCEVDDPDRDNGSTPGESTTPTIILLPYGRMLVVDRTVFAQLQSDHTGIDFMELSANLIRAQRFQTGSSSSILDSDTTSKGVSPTSLGFSPPAYEDIFGDKNSDLPPSYSEVSLLFRTYNRPMLPQSENLEMCNMERCNERASDNNNYSDPAEVNNENNLNKELDDESTCDDIGSEEGDPSTSQPNGAISVDSTNECSTRKESSM